MPDINLEEFHSEEVHDIISRSPTWIVRNGTIILGALVVLFLIGAAYINFPEVITVPVTLSNANLPITVSASSTGLIKEIYCSEGQKVKKDQLIAVLDNSANTSDVLRLKRFLQNADSLMMSTRFGVKVSEKLDLELGDLQPDYIALEQLLHNLNGSYPDAIGTSPRQDLKFKARALVSLLRAKINSWKKNYFITSPSDGIAVFNKTLALNQSVKKEDTLLTLLPFTNSQRYLVTVKVPVSRITKIKAGQPVLIHLDEYPSGEFGIIQASTTKINPIAIGNTYTVTLTLKNGLHTSNGVDLIRRPVLSGRAEIIVNEPSLLRRLMSGMIR